MLQQIVQNILVYVVMVTVLKGLVGNEGFLEIFRFVSGMILILLCVSPILGVVSGDQAWVRRLQKNIFQEDLAQLEQEAQLAEGSFEEILLRECEAQLEQQLQELAQTQGEQVGEVEVDMEKNEEGDLAVAAVSMSVLGENGQTQEDAVVPVEKIVVTAGAEASASPESGREEGKVMETQDAKTRKLKKKICEQYELSGEVVIVWRENGENY